MDLLAAASRLRYDRLKLDWGAGELVAAVRQIAREVGTTITISDGDVFAFERGQLGDLPPWYRFAHTAIALDGMAEPFRSRRREQLLGASLRTEPPDQGSRELVDCYLRLGRDDREALLQIARSMAGRAGPEDTLHRLGGAGAN